MRIRVLHLITRLEPGGAQRNTLYTVAHLDRTRFAPALAWGTGDLLDQVARNLNDVYRTEIPDLMRPVSPRHDARALSTIRRTIRAFRPHIVHTHSSKAGILGRLAARLEDNPLTVHSIHGFGFTPLQPVVVRAVFFAAEKIAARWTDHFIAVSRSNLELGLATGLFDHSQVTLIRSGIELARFRSAGGDPSVIRREFDIPPDAPLITQIGNFKAQKAPLDFVRAAYEIHSRFANARFIMVGEGELRCAAEQMARELGLNEAMSFCGWRDDIPNLLAATTVSVLSSRHEGLPRAVVESLAAGVPVVATRVDGTVEVIRHGINGFLVDPGAISEISQRVCAILAEPELRQRLQVAAPAHLGEFDIDLMVRQQEDLYACLFGRRNSSSPMSPRSAP